MAPPALFVEDENAVVERIERWLNHGFFPYNILAKDTANAYLHNYTTYRPNLNVGWQKAF
ncbi:unnamed protein product [Penicillium roqueforti FM164]|uniref:Genomic scaffold, ProqFM164S01 n=1 Tax=Penicillium roqueforti (strain FM164) TaxID=1365484 RepID=W6PQ62_PENRF|nr:unnamed protein product [Penicillium roqueforti FM164]